MKRVSSNTKLLESATTPFDVECLLSDFVDLLWTCAGKPKFFYRKVVFCPQHVGPDDLVQMEAIKAKLPDVEVLKRCQKNFRKSNEMDPENVRRDGRLTVIIQKIETVDAFFKELILRIKNILIEKQKNEPFKPTLSEAVSKASVVARDGKVSKLELKSTAASGGEPLRKIAEASASKLTPKMHKKQAPDKKYGLRKLSASLSILSKTKRATRRSILKKHSNSKRK